MRSGLIHKEFISRHFLDRAFRGGVAYNQGCMRQAWVASRAGDKIRTQIHYARQGRITEEMEYVARRERMDAETVRAKWPGTHDHPC